MKIRVENGLAFTANWQGARRFHSFGVYVLACAFIDHKKRITRAIQLSDKARMTCARYDLLMQYVSAMEARQKALQECSPVPLEHVNVRHA
jgi:hypothetical protein